MEDENFKFDPELLRGFVSPSIFDFMTSTDSSAGTSYLVNAQAPTDDHVPVADHILPGEASASEPSTFNDPRRSFVVSMQPTI